MLNSAKIEDLQWVFNRADVVGVVEAGKARFTVPGFLCAGVDYVGLSNRSGRGQGVLLYYREWLQPFVKHVRALDRSVWLTLQGNADAPALTVAVQYMNPGRPATTCKEWFGQLQEHLVDACTRGHVIVLGDFNAHTRTLSDHVDTRQLLDDLCLGRLVPEGVIPVRHNTDTSPANPYGQALVDVCQATGVVIANGRAPGDEHGARTFLASALPSVIDYCLVDTCCFPMVQSLCVEDKPWDWGDHAPIMAVLQLDAFQLDAPGGASGSVSQSARVPRWDPNKKVEYGQALCTGQAGAKLAAIQQGVSDGSLQPEVAADKLVSVIHDTACEVFGVVQPHRCSAAGRRPNPWFKHCQGEWKLMKQAIARQDTAAAAAYRKSFNALRRRWKRFYNKHLIAYLKDAWQHNPRKFWAYFKGTRRHELVHDLAAWRRYWCTLFGGDGSTAPALPQGLSAIEQWCQELGDDVLLSCRRNGGVLNAPITVSEVAEVFGKLSRGRAAGPDGIRAEFLRDVVVPAEGCSQGPVPIYRNVLLPVVHAVVGAVFASGCYPVSWSQAAISAVFKKGDPQQHTNYRGIAVGNTLGKVFSMVLDRRLSRWAELHGHRAMGQAGFRKGMRTTDQLFILRHMLSRFQGTQRKLFMCFVDFQKAYDSVRRDLLVKRLACLGVSGAMLRAIVCMYCSVPVCARQQGAVSEPFQSNVGVKQGDPLSPLLFGLFVDEIEQHLCQHIPHSGVELNGRLCRMLLYADDIVLFATRASHLQQQLDALHGFCEAKGMTVNVQKTKVLVFNGGKRQATSFTYAGDALECVDSFRYLGVEVHRSKGFGVAPGVVGSAAMKAVCGMMRQVVDRDIRNIGLRVQLFNSIVMPVLQYGCEVWSTPFLRDPSNPVSSHIQRVQSQFLRQVAGGWVRKSTPVRLLCAEFGCRPVSWQWCKLLCRYWNRLVKQQHHPLLHDAFIEGLQDWADQGFQLGGKSWSAEVLSMVQTCAPEVFQQIVQAVRNRHWPSIPTLDSDVILSAWEKSWWVWPDPDCDPRGEEGALATYAAWMSSDVGGAAPYVHYAEPVNAQALLSLVRFRLGVHNLRMATGRWDNTPRHERLCRKCTQQSVEDEMHVVFECPWYQSVRAKFASLFVAAQGSLRRLMCHPDQDRVAWLVHRLECRHMERSAVA